MKHLIHSLAGSGAVQILNIFTGILAARLLLPEGRGELALIMLWSGIIAAIGCWSTDQAVTYYSAKNAKESNKILVATQIIALGLCIVSFIIGLVVLPLVLGRQQPALLDLSILYFSLYLPMYVFGLPVSGYLLGTHRFFEWNVIRVVGPVVYLLSILVFWSIGPISVSKFIYALLISNAIGFIFFFVFIRHVGWLNSRPNGSHFRLIASYSTRVHLSSMLSLANGRIDQALISLQLSASDLGLYVVAITLASPIGLVVSPISALAFPKITAQGTPEGRLIVLGRYLRLTIVLSVGAMVALLLAGNLLLGWLFGSAFLSASAVLWILVVAAFVGAIRVMLVTGFKAHDRIGAINQSEMVNLVVAAIALVILLPALGLEGAALAILAARVVGTGYLVILLPRNLKTTFLKLAKPGMNDWRLIRSQLNEFAGRDRVER